MKLVHRNTPFTCRACGAVVAPATGGIRNHCPACLCSLHVDEQLPGDRMSGCGGVMDPVAWRRRHGEVQVEQRCRDCGRRHWNVVTDDDDQAVLRQL